MTQATIWLNKSFSTTFNVIETIRAADTTGALRILCTHTNPDFPALRLSDHAEVEPKHLNESAYLDYCLDFAWRHRVDLFIPGKNLTALARQRHRFEEAGTRLLYAAEADTLKLLESKAAVYAALATDPVRLPEYTVVNDLTGFDQAVARLSARHMAVCFKPAVSVFGLGFHILTESGSALDRLLRGDPIRLGVAEARQYLGERARFADLLVMQYLSGPERSVDCLSRDGELLRCVVRRKPQGDEGGQLLEDNPAIAETVRRLTARLRLNALFNVQFRDSEGVPYLLEINPRMSGGLHYACLSGVALPYWAVRLALGTASPEDIPTPRTGLHIGHVDRAIVL
ncbi:MAG: ATP-grasp domain-containing protein [Gemmataceae bacterium]|nr:ATP-grasp domain-containing protein [Gemmataceae bacterium]